MMTNVQNNSFILKFSGKFATVNIKEPNTSTCEVFHIFFTKVLRDLCMIVAGMTW